MLPVGELTEAQVMDLNVVLSQSPEAAFYQMDALFSDAELFSTGGDNALKSLHPHKYLASRDFYSFLSNPPPCLSMVAILFQSSVSKLSGVIDTATRAGFILAGVKQMRISDADRARFCEGKESGKKGAGVLKRVANGELIFGLCFEKENGIKELIDSFGMVLR